MNEWINWSFNKSIKQTFFYSINVYKGVHNKKNVAIKEVTYRVLVFCKILLTESYEKLPLKIFCVCMTYGQNNKSAQFVVKNGQIQERIVDEICFKNYAF